MEPAEQQRTLKLIGFWQQPLSLGLTLPHPKEFVDPTWRLDIRDRLVAYLRGGHMVNGYFGYSYCRFRDGPDDDEMGSCDLTDGTWVWPEGLAVYVELFHVKLPEDFVNDAIRTDFTLQPDKLTGLTMYTPYSADYWREWCRANRSNRLKAFLSRYV